MQSAWWPQCFGSPHASGVTGAHDKELPPRAGGRRKGKKVWSCVFLCSNAWNLYRSASMRIQEHSASGYTTLCSPQALLRASNAQRDDSTSEWRQAAAAPVLEYLWGGLLRRSNRLHLLRLHFVLRSFTVCFVVFTRTQFFYLFKEALHERSF